MGTARRGENFPLLLITHMGLFGPFGRLEVPLWALVDRVGVGVLWSGAGGM